MKKYILISVIIILFTVNLYSDESIINNIFFNDFKKIGIYVSDNLIYSTFFLSTSIITTLTLINNDKFLMDKIQSQRTDFNDKFFDFINYGGDAVYIMAFNSLFFLFSEKEKRTGKNLIECLAVNGIISYGLKSILGRKRPSQTENPKVFDFFKLSDNSMPSGHTLVAFTCAEVLNDSYGIWYLTYPLATLVGYARIYKNSHWVSDVFAGALLGVVLTRIILDRKENLQLTIKVNANFAMPFIKYNF